MRQFLAAALALGLVCATLAWAQSPPVLQQPFGTGRITDFPAPKPPPAAVRAERLAAAPFGEMAIAEWKPNVKDAEGKVFPLAFRDKDDNWWFLAFKSHGETFDGQPSALRGWPIRTTTCYRFVTADGSFFLGTKGMTTIEKSFTPIAAAQE